MTTRIARSRTLGLLAAGLLLPALAACSKSAPEQQPDMTIENDTGVTEVAPAETLPANAVEPAPAINVAEEAPPPPPARTVDEQVLDDASTTGMTARVQREPAPAETAPADVSAEQK